MFNQYPYLNLNDLNLDYILKAIKEMRYEVTNFVSINAIKYADPIQWNITSQYEKNTIVIDPQTGTAYISVAAVPAGVALTRPEYWTVVFDLGSFVTRAAKNFTTRYEQDTTTTATFPTTAGEWLVWGDTLYVANVNITAGDSYVVDGNIRRITVEEVKNTIIQLIADNYNAIITMIGDLNDLTTTNKSNLVAAINEVLSTLNSTAGDLDDLNTTDKSNLVAAINEILVTLATTTGNLDDLVTTDKTNLVSAINEVKTDIINFSGYNVFDVTKYGAVGDGVTDDTDAIKDAVAAAELTRGTVYFPTGVYLVSDTIHINSPVNLIGQGASRSKITRTTDYGDTIVYGSDAIPAIDGFEIAYLWFYHDFGGYTAGGSPSDMRNKPTSGAHLLLYNPIRMNLHDCEFWDMPINVKVFGSAKCNITHNTFSGLWDPRHPELQVTTANLGLYKSTSALTAYQVPTDIHIEDNDITGYLSEVRTTTYGTYTYSGVNNIGALYGIYCEGCEVMQIHGGNIGGQNYGIFLSVKDANAMLSIDIEDVFFDGNDQLAIFADNGNGIQTAQNLIVRGCHFIGQNNSYHALWIGAASVATLATFGSVIIANNTFSNYEGHCIGLFRANNVLINNNIFRDYNTNNGFASNVFDGSAIYVGTVDGLTVQDNSFGGGFGYEDYGTNHCYLGMYIESGSDNVMICNNNMPSNKVNIPILCAITDFSSHNYTFVDNVGFNGTYDTNKTGVATDYSSAKKNPYARPAMMQILGTAISDVVINGISYFQTSGAWFGYISPSDMIQISGTVSDLKFSLK